MAELAEALALLFEPVVLKHTDCGGYFRGTPALMPRVCPHCRWSLDAWRGAHYATDEEIEVFDQILEGRLVKGLKR